MPARLQLLGKLEEMSKLRQFGPALFLDHWPRGRREGLVLGGREHRLPPEVIVEEGGHICALALG
jgi:hypothetical protein